MAKPLNRSQIRWVEETLASLSPTELVAQLLCTDITKWEVDQLEDHLRQWPLGSVFIGPNPSKRWLELTAKVRDTARIPIMVASDFEHGAGCMIPDNAVDFPWAMAVGAAADEKLAYEVGLASAEEGRVHGVHWMLGPQVDLNLNYNNPVVNVRAISDRPELVARLSRAWIRGIQKSGTMAACAKHFPGDGVDDRDQHLCTSVNSLSVRQWMQTFGCVWRDVIDAGARSIMVGHISFPAWEKISTDSEGALPATLSAKVQVDLLRAKLGFQGVILSDAISMGGITSRVPAREIVVENLRAGGDVVLFGEAQRDIASVLDAMDNGRIPEKQLRASARRVLEMKAHLGLHRAASSRKALTHRAKRWERSAQVLADSSITLVRTNAAITASLEKSTRVLTVSVFYTDGPEFLCSRLDSIDDELRRQGFAVDHLDNPEGSELRKIAHEYARVFINISILPHSRMGTVRVTQSIHSTFWGSFWVDATNTVFTSFGSPYLLHEFPHLPNLILAYGNCEASQRAAVRVWLGKLNPEGKCPVLLKKHEGFVDDSKAVAKNNNINAIH